MSGKKVFVSGCFDLLHSGHIAFLHEAAGYGDVYVGIGSDRTILHLKGRYPVYSQEERAYMLKALRCVKDCLVNSGDGILDFHDDILRVGADILFVNEDGHAPEKEKFCQASGIEYRVSRRIPHARFPERSTTALRNECDIPYRIDLAGGWLDQPLVSEHAPGAVLTISIEPTIEFNDRSGMATSTRKKAIELWHASIPEGDREKLAKTLFCFENPPGTRIVSGSQDALGIVLPGLNKLDYAGAYWPENIVSVRDQSILAWLEDHLYLVTLGPRHSAYTVVDNTVINRENAARLALAADRCWDAMLRRDLDDFGRWFRASFDAQVRMFPNMLSNDIHEVIDAYAPQARGLKLSGAGGGGYLILVSDRPIDHAIKIHIRR
jgi:cytidyltransferase-like protein